MIIGTQDDVTWYSTEGFDFDLRMIADNFKSDILSAKRRNLVARHLLFISDVIFSKKCFSLGIWMYEITIKNSPSLQWTMNK